MAKNFIEYEVYNADVVPYSGYDSSKTVLGPDIYKFTGSTNYDYYIGPNTTTFRDITQDTGVNNWGDISAISYSGDSQWLFALKGFVNGTSTTDIAMYEFNSKNYTYNYVGAITCTNYDGAVRINQGLSANLNYYTAGTVQVSGTSVTGTSTDWISSRISIGSRIGFGSNDPANITNWYRLSNYTLMNSIPTLINGATSCCTVDSFGKIYIGGAFTTYSGVTANRLIRLNPNGTLDSTFSGVTTGFNNSVSVVSVDSSNGIYVGGDFTSYNGVTVGRIIKLNYDGSIDTSFSGGTGFNSTVTNIEFDSTGKIWVGGSFTTYKGVANTSYLTKIDQFGTRDGTYPAAAATNPSSTVNTIAVDNNNDVYIGGAFTQIGATANNSRYIAKILKTGGLAPTFVVGPTGTNNAFNGSVNKIIYKPLSNSVIVGGTFTIWKSGANQYLTELSSIGDALLVSKHLASVVYDMLPDGLGNIYIYSNYVTKRNINTLNISSTTFNPNIFYQQSTSVNKIMGLSPSGETLYTLSSNLTVDSGFVAVDTTEGKRVLNFSTTPDYGSQRITLNTSAGIFPAGTPYVVEELTLSVQRTGVGVFLIQGLSKDDFTISPTAIALPALNFMGLSKGMYGLDDYTYASAVFGYNASTSLSNQTVDTKILPKDNVNHQYLYAHLSGRILRYDIKNPYITILGGNSQSRVRYSLLSQAIVTNAAITNAGAGLSSFASGKIVIANMQSGSASGITSLYVDNTGVAQTTVSDLNNLVTPLYSTMSEVPPGSTTTYNAAGNVSRVYYMSTIDKFIILNTSSTAKSYVTGYRTNLQQPTLTGTLYGRDTYNNLAYDNSYDLAFLVNGQQLQGNTSNVSAPRYPDTLGTGFFGSVEDGVLHLCRPLATIQNNLYAVPMGCESKYVDYSNNALITPKITLPNVVGVTGLYINQLKEYGSGAFSIPPEVIVSEYRISGIDDNSGQWTEFTNVKNLNDDIICEGVLDTIYIQFRFSFKIAGNACIPNRIYGFALSYEDDKTDSHYSPSVVNSNLTNKIFAWRQDSLWNSNIPNLKIRLYNATNNNIVFYDTVTNSSSGTWEYSTDNGVSWIPWDSSADVVGNYIRYSANFVPSGIKLRVGLNTI